MSNQATVFNVSKVSDAANQLKFLSIVGSAIAPLRSVLRSLSYRRDYFGKGCVVFGVLKW